MPSPLIDEESSYSEPTSAPQRNDFYNGQSMQSTVGQSTQSPREYAFSPKVVCTNYHGKQSTVLGSVQIGAGVLSILFNALSLSFRSYLNNFGSGIWGGIIGILCGSFGIAAGKSMSRYKIITYMVLSLLSSIASGILFLFSIEGAVQSHYYREYYYCGDRYAMLNREVVTISAEAQNAYDRCKSDQEFRYRVRFSMDIMLCLVGAVQAAAAIWGSMLGCKVVCICNAPTQGGSSSQGPPQFVVLSHQPGGQVVASYSGPGNQAPQRQHQVGGGDFYPGGNGNK